MVAHPMLAGKGPITLLTRPDIGNIATICIMCIKLLLSASLSFSLSFSFSLSLFLCLFVSFSLSLSFYLSSLPLSLSFSPSLSLSRARLCTQPPACNLALALASHPVKFVYQYFA